MILAIESAVEGGSIWLYSDGPGGKLSLGEQDVARAEELLPAIDRLIQKAGGSRGDLTMIAVSAGPGSFTGIRIGLATAIGLSRGLDIPMSSVSLLKVLAVASGVDDVMAAVPMGRGHACIQRFNTGQPDGDPASVAEDRLPSIADGLPVAAPHSLIPALGEAVTIDMGNDLARRIALYSLGRPPSSEPPIFVSKDAAA